MLDLEEALLDLAQRRGLVAQDEVFRLQSQCSSGDSATILWTRHGPIIDQLLILGLLKEEQVQALVQELEGLADTLPWDRALPPDAPRLPPTARAFPLPEWDRYEHIEYLAQGGMARVYRAQDPRLKRSVALKLLHNPDHQALARFMQEARFQARLEHPHVCRIYEVGEVAGQPYIAMEFVNGRPIDEVASAMGREMTIRAIRDVAEAVHAGHRLGLIHRDLKPANIMVEQREEGWWPVVLDFGLASEREGQGLTLAGTLMGTPDFMAPEQARGETDRIDRRTDVYALGCTLYALLTGAPPFRGDTIMKTMLRVIQEEPARPRSLDSGFPADLETILLKCLEKEPQRRYASARLLAEDLGRYLDGEPLLARPIGWHARAWKRVRRNPVLAAVLAVAMGVVLLLGGFLLRSQLRAKAQAQLAQRFGLESERVEGSFRRAQMLPLHDMRNHKAELRAWMLRLEGEMKSLGPVAAGPGQFALGRACLALGDSQPALKHLELAWKLGIQGPETAGALGLAHVAILREALDELERLPNQNVKDARRVALDRLHVQPALHFLRLSGSSLSVQQEGLVAYLEKRYDQALAKAGQALAQDPWMVEAHLLVAEVKLAQAHGLMDQGGYQAAAEACAGGLAAAQRAENLARSLVDAYALEGEALSMAMELAIRLGVPYTEKAQAAQASLEQALRADPEAAEVHVKLARLFRAWADAEGERGRDPDGLLAASVSQSLAALHDRPDHPEASLLLSMTYRGLADNRSSHGLDPLPVLDQALAIGRQAIALRPRDAIAVNNQGNAYLSRAEFLQDGGQDATEDLEAALASFSEASACNPFYASPWINAGICYRRLATQRALQGGDPLPLMGKAQASYRSALRINPSNLTTQHNLGVLCCYKAEMEFKRGMDPRASLADSTATFRQALEINPGFARSHSGLGRVSALRGLNDWLQGGNPAASFQEAIVHYRQALKSNAADPEHYQRIGQVWLYTAQYQLDQGREHRQALEAARQAFSQSLAVNPRNADSLLGMARVQLLREAWPEAERVAAQARSLSARSAEPLLVQAELALAKAATLAGGARDNELKKAAAALDAASAREVRSASVEVFRAQLLLLGTRSGDQDRRAREAENLLRQAFQQDRSLELLYRRWLIRTSRSPGPR